MFPKIAIFLCIISVSFLSAQSQFGITAGVNRISVNSRDLIAEPGLGYEIGIQNIAGLHRRGDLISEFLYASNGINLTGNLPQDQSTRSFNFSIRNLNINFLYNRYLIIPDSYKPHFAIQGGLSFSVLNGWTSKEEISGYRFGSSNYELGDFANLSPINAGWIIGIGTGFEQLRINLRYCKLLSNPLKRTIASAEGFDDMKASPSYVSLSLAYFFDKFY